MTKLLVVEDNREFREAAASFLRTVPSIEVVYAKDFVEGLDHIIPASIDAAILDCFFPEETGTNKTHFGKLIVRILSEESSSMKQAKSVNDFIKEISKYVTMDDELEGYFRNFLQGIQPEDSPIMAALKQTFSLLGPDANAMIAKNSLKYRRGPKLIDYFKVYEEAMQQSEHNQPLGIGLGLRLEAAGKPFVLATSTYHHDALTQPIQDYCGAKGWTLIDCAKDSEHQKADAKFWQRAYEYLEAKL